MHWVRNPDPGSNFERNTRLLRRLPAWAIMLLLRLFQYNGIIFLHQDAEKILGHVFFQKRHASSGEPELHLFSLFVNEAKRGQGYGPELLKEFLTYAWENGHLKVRVGTDRNEAIKNVRARFFEKLPADIGFGATELGDGWIVLTKLASFGGAFVPERSVQRPEDGAGVRAVLS